MASFDPYAVARIVHANIQRIAASYQVPETLRDLEVEGWTDHIAHGIVLHFIKRLATKDKQAEVLSRRTKLDKFWRESHKHYKIAGASYPDGFWQYCRYQWWLGTMKFACWWLEHSNSPDISDWVEAIQERIASVRMNRVSTQVEDIHLRMDRYVDEVRVQHTHMCPHLPIEGRNQHASHISFLSMDTVFEGSLEHLQALEQLEKDVRIACNNREPWQDIVGCQRALHIYNNAKAQFEHQSMTDYWQLHPATPHQSNDQH